MPTPLVAPLIPSIFGKRLYFCFLSWCVNRAGGFGGGIGFRVPIEPAALDRIIFGNRIVERAAERIEQGAASVDLPPMSSYERKLVHDLVAEKGLVSESEGEGRDRHTVITSAR